MNFLDTRTILVGEIFIMVVCAVVLGSLWRRYRHRSPALVFWPAGFALYTLALQLLALRGLIPDFLSLVCGVPLSLGGVLLLVEGTERYVGLGDHARLLRNKVVWLALLVPVHVWFSLGEPSLAARTINLSIGVMVFMGQGAWRLRRDAPAALRAAARPTCLVFAAFVLVSLVRIIAEAMTPAGEDFLWAGLHYGVAFLAYEMLFVALAFTLFLMVNQRLLTDLEEDIDRRRQAEEELRRSHAQLELRVDERTRELSRSNAALHESEEKFRRMAASARDAILMVDDAGRLTYWNEAAGTMFGYAADEALGQDLHLLLAPACHHEPYQRGYLQFRETGTGPVIGALQTLTARRKDATEFPIELAIAPLQLQGRWHALGMVRDITARQKTEAALRQAHDELEHRVQERTAALERANAELRAAQAEAKRLLTVTEQSRRVLLSMVEDQNAAVMKLRESEERFRRAVVDAPFPIMLHAEDGAVLQVSESWCEITGYTEAELATIADWTERAYGERRQRVQADIDALYRLDHRKHEGDYAIRTKSGAVRIWEFSSAPLGRLPDGRRLVISMALDVTERRNAEREIRTLNAELEQRVRERTVELEAANKELEAFSYSVSHDLRAPLRGIDGWSAALVEDYGKTLDATAGEYLERVRSEAQRMGRLIDDLLRLSRVSRAELRREAVDLSALARTVAERLRGAWPGRRIEFVIASDLMTEGDAALLEVVLTNLLDNACKFTGPRAEARIEFGGWPGEVEPPSALSGGSTPPIPLAAAKSSFVRDNGVGFDPAYAGRLFGAFQRMHKEDDFPGTGVGLATVHRIIRRHGGWIRAESHLGQGATFYFTLSAASADGRERRPGPPGSAGPDDAPAMTPPHES